MVENKDKKAEAQLMEKEAQNPARVEVPYRGTTTGGSAATDFASHPATAPAEKTASASAEPEVAENSTAFAHDVAGRESGQDASVCLPDQELPVDLSQDEDYESDSATTTAAGFSDKESATGAQTPERVGNSGQNGDHSAIVRDAAQNLDGNTPVRQDTAANARQEKHGEPDNNISPHTAAEDSGIEDETEIPAEMEHPTDLAERLENLPLEEQVTLLCSLPAENAAEALVEMDGCARVELMEELDTGTAASLVSEMSPDDAADILDELDDEHREELLRHLEHEDAEEILSLMAFDPETAGGIMNTEIVVLDQSLTVDEAIKVLRRDIEDKEIPYYAYVVDEDEHLTGVLSLRDLLVSPRGTILKDAASSGRALITVIFDEDRSEVARLFSDYNFMALPVVDHEGRLLGVVTHDDVIDMINEMASEDMLGMVGAGQDESVDTPARDSIRMRLPWLVVNMLNSSLSAFVVYMFEGSIATMPILAVLMPMVANQAGNTGQQALAVIIRQLALENMDRKRSIKAVHREVKISLCNGLLLSILVWLGVYLLEQSPMLSSLMVFALAMDMLLGALAGASIPLILKRLGRDPAQASSIFLTAITDGAGFFIFLGLATLLLF